MKLFVNVKFRKNNYLIESEKLANFLEKNNWKNGGGKSE